MSLSREQMLIEMGISPIWVLREPGGQINAPTAQTESVAAVVAEKVPVSVAQLASTAVVETPVTPGENVVPQEVFQQNATTIETKAGPRVDSLNWPELARQVAACKACPLYQQRKQAVLGVGDLNPDWLFIGEGPGAEEDTQGEPFVGQAGKLLDNMLAALDIGRGNKVYIGNAVKCRPPGNRTPEAAEIATCRPYLERQIALLKPKIIVLLGKVAVHSLLHEDKTLASMRGTRFEYAGIPVVVTYHPAYLLRNLPDKSKAWEDLVFARGLLRAQASPELPF
ncbi:MAG TPA: uracil-DNA glycosylase [Azonexus sp.]|nr:uracil-DNA glycosylase [Azonexus sp.]